MAKAVFTTKIDPAYDDLPESRYHFPRSYYNQVSAAVGDFIIYYEPRRSTAALSSRGGRQAYFAVARVLGIEPDPALSDHFYARITDFLEFDRPVPFKEGAHYYERALQRPDGKTSKGAFGRAVRVIADNEFDAILSAAFSAAVLSTHASADIVDGLHEPQADFERPVIERLVSRPFRDDAFRRQVRSAYDNRCALTGLRLINGGGRPEVEAAHIRPVASHGPDSVRNGMALSGTAHWMFDRGLVTVDDDFSIVTASGHLPDDVERLLLPSRQMHRPASELLHPHRHYLRWHREHVYKG